jgi:hypothetical protein
MANRSYHPSYDGAQKKSMPLEDAGLRIRLTAL